MKTIRYFLYFFVVYFIIFLFSTTTIKIRSRYCALFHFIRRFRYNDELFCLLCEKLNK